MCFFIARALRLFIETSSVTMCLLLVMGSKLHFGDFELAVCIMNGDFVKEKDPKGTHEFMALGCYNGEYNELIDVYLFGMCLLEMITGKYPYMECSNQMHIFKKVCTGVKPVSRKGEGLQSERYYRDIIEKCMLPMSVKPSAEELLKDQFFLNGGSFNML